MDFWDSNLAALAKYRPELDRLVRAHRRQVVAELVVNQEGMATARLLSGIGGAVWAYQSENPWDDAAVHLHLIPPDNRSLALFVGMGLGYGPLLVLKERPTIARMAIFEPCLDLFCFALQAVDLVPLICAETVSFFVGEIDYDKVEQEFGRFAALLDTHILRHPPSFQWKNEIYAALDSRIFMLFNQINARGGTTSRHGEKFFHNRYDNLTLVPHCLGLDSLHNRFHKKPAIVVAAGPSLDESLPLLKKMEGNCVLIAADSALGPLLRAGIEPDFVTTLDYQDLNFEKVSPYLSRPAKGSLVAMIKASPLITKRFPAKHLFLAFPEDIPHAWVMAALGVKVVVPSLSAVPHLSLGLALVLGADPIVFVGQDLAYTKAGSDHAAGTVLAGGGVPDDRELFSIPAVDGGQVSSDRVLLTQKKQLEDIIRANQSCSYLNATAAGADIEGTERMDLAEVSKRYCVAQLDVAATVDKAVEQCHTHWNFEGFVTACKENVKQAAVAGELLMKNRKLAASITHRLKKNTVFRHARAIKDLPTDLAGLLSQYDKNNNRLDTFRVVGDHLLELTFQSLNENDVRGEQNKEILASKGYLAWLQAEIERLDYVNAVRLEALAAYRERLRSLVTHFEEEKKLLARMAAAPSPEKAMALARRYCETGQYRQAKDILVGNTGDNAEAYLVLGEIHAELFDLDKAKSCWRAAHDRGIGHAQETAVFRERFIAAWIKSIVEPGLKVPGVLARWLVRFAEILEPGDTLPKGLLSLWRKESERIQQLMQSGDVSGAVQALTPWEVLSNLLPEYYNLLSRCWRQKGEGDMAWQVAEKAVALQGENASWLAWSARLAFEVGRFDEGIKRLQQASALDPETAVLWDELGDVLAGEGDAAGAAIAYERCYIVLPHRLDVLRKMGDCLLRDNRPEAARAAYQAVLAQQNSGQSGVE